MINVDQIPFIAMEIRIWRAFAIIYPRPETKWRVYAMMLPFGFINVMQFFYVYNVMEDVMKFTLSLFFASVFFNAIFRCFLIIIAYRKKLELLLKQLEEMYNEIKDSDDRLAFFILMKTTRWIRRIASFTLFCMLLDIFGTVFLPFLIGERVHPMGVAIPMVNMTSSPIYEIFYVLELPYVSIVGVLYLSYMTIFIAISLFGKALLRILIYKISQIEPEAKAADIIPCIRYYGRIKTLVVRFNDLVTYIACIEYIVFSVVIGILLFYINVASTLTQVVIMSLYIFSVLYMLFFFYWHANELMVESIKISEAVYNMPWYTFDTKLRKMVLIFFMETQRPLMIKIGNVYPMTLETFQSLLNSSYQYFTLLHGITRK